MKKMTSQTREVSEYTLAVSTLDIGEMGYNIYRNTNICRTGNRFGYTFEIYK